MTDSSTGNDRVSIGRNQDKILTPGLRNRIWNRISFHFFPYEILGIPIGKSNGIYFLVRSLYDSFFKEDADVIKRCKHVEYFRNEVKKMYQGLDWIGVCKFLDFVANFGKIEYISDFANVEEVNIEKFVEECNTVFNEETIPYRFVNRNIVEVHL